MDRDYYGYGLKKPEIPDSLNVKVPTGIFEGNNLKAIKYSVEFTVPDFQNRPLGEKQILHSPPFFFGNSDEFQARIVCYFSCKCPYDQNNHCRKPYGCTYVHFQMQDKEKRNRIKNVALIRLGNMTKRCIHSSCQPVAFVGYDPVYGVCISKVPYIYEDGMKDRLKAGNFSLCCEIVIGVELAPSVVDGVPLHKTLVEDIGLLLNKGHLSDVTLIVGEEKVSAHKAILGARSPVFQKMFLTDMVESNSSVVHIPDITYEVMLSLLIYVYTGNTPNVDSLGESLLIAADKYQLDDLKVKCEKKIAEGLTVENAARIFCLAIMYRARVLKARAVSFIKLHLREVVETEGWVAARKELPFEVTVNFL